MDTENSSVFGVIDYCMFIGILAVSVSIGLYSSYIGNKSPEEFLMGNRSLKPLPVAMSLMTSYVSSIAILGFSGEVYGNGMQISTIAIGGVLGILCSSHFVLPILFPLRLTSINEYLELRFKSSILRQTMSFLHLWSLVMMTGLLLYAPTIALTSFTNLNTLQCILLLGVVCTLYSAFGGIKSVVWTDVFQMSVMIMGLAIAVTVGCYQNGGVIKTLYISSEGGRLSLFNMDLSPFVRHTFFNTIAMGFFFYLNMYSCHQIVFQRMCAVKSIEGAKSVMKYNAICCFLTLSLIFSGGLAAFAAYHGCDPMALGKIKRKEDIMPFYVTDKIKFVPGIAGLFSAALIGASLSSISSCINASAALMWKDVCLKFPFFQNASPRNATITNIILSFMAGSICILLAIIFSKVRSLIAFGITLKGSMAAPVFGVFLIAFFLPKCNMKGVWTGSIATIIITTWLVVGGMYYKTPPTNLDFSAEDCLQLNHSSHGEFKIQKSMLMFNNFTEEKSAHSFSITDVYQISYTLYTVIGPVLCVFVAVIVSFITGNQNIDEVSPKYISPSVRRFYWTKEQLKFIHDDREIGLIDCNVNSHEKEEEEGEHLNL